MEKFNREMESFFRTLYAGEERVLVFGEGKPHARIMLTGEAPGEQETIKRRPFVGKAGKNLDEFLAKTGFDRAEMYVTNAVKFRPTRVSPAGNIVNRPPTREEIELFLPWLKKEIALVSPACVVTMGNTALQALMGRKTVIGDAHGRFACRDGQMVFPIYHPASLIYNRALAPQYERDLLVLQAWRREYAGEMQK